MSTDQVTKKDEESGGLTSSPMTNSFEYPLVKLLVSSIVAGLIIVVYVLIIVKLEKSQVKVAPIDKAAKLAAHELTTVTVNHPRFGLIGLCDTKLTETISYALEAPSIRSLNSINASINAASRFGDAIKSNQIDNLVSQDLSLLKELQADLYNKLDRTVKSGADKEKNRVFLKTYKKLEDSLPPNSTIKELKLTIGSYGKSSGRATFVPALPDDLNQPFVENGYYKENIFIPATNQHHFRFYKIYNSNKIVPAEKFVLNSEGMLPSAVLLEATIEDKKTHEQVIKKSCSLIGSAPPARTPTCLAIRFPQGIPSRFNTVSKLLQSDIWLSSGHWSEAVVDRVPGRGHLSPTIDPVLESMTAKNAIEVSLYNWIKAMTPAPAPSRLVAMLNSNFYFPLKKKQRYSTSIKSINSFLAMETGARERAFLYANMPNNAGQIALANCFEFPGSRELIPSSALPVVVNSQGEATLSGLSHFDEVLVQDYLDAIYSTNLAAIETMAVAKEISRSYQVKLAQTANLSADQLVTFTEMVRMARIAGKNALKIAETSFQVSSQNFTLCRNGLHRITAPEKSYLLGRKLIFKPIYMPLNESSLLKLVKSKRSFQDKIASQAWLRNNGEILKPIKEYFGSIAGVKVEGKPLDMVLAQKLSGSTMQPTTVIFDSRDIQTGGQLIPHLSQIYPFKSLAIKKNQSVYYCSNALQTGTSPPVIWSVLLRDNNFHQSTSRTGQKIEYRNQIWCQNFDPPFSSCPDLSFEIQLRRPLAEVKEIPRSTLVTDPRFERKVPLVPPVPAEMM